MGWVGAALRKGTGKPPWRKERAFVLAGLPGMAFSCLCGQQQGWQRQRGQQGHCSPQSLALQPLLQACRFSELLV